MLGPDNHDTKMTLFNSNLIVDDIKVAKESSCAFPLFFGPKIIIDLIHYKS